MKEKVAIITGASRGTGKEIAIYLAQLGYFTILIARNSELLQQVQRKIIEAGGKAIF